MTSLRERFNDAVANPAPPSRLSGDEVYATAWRRRRARIRVAAAAGAGLTALAVAVALGVAGGGPNRGSPAPAASDPTASPATSPSGQPILPTDGTVEEAVATDVDHLYAILRRCPSDDPATCVRVLYGSDDGGRTWTERKRDNPSMLTVLAPGVLGATFTSKDVSTWRFSTDGGRNWTDLRQSTGTVPAVPNGGWAACYEDNSGVARCAVYAVDGRTGTAKMLARQPPTIIPTGITTARAGTRLWVAGLVLPRNRPAVSISSDDGRTWSTRVLGQDEADYPQDINNQSVSVATADGTTAYAVVTIVVNNGQNRLLVYRTTDGGQTWQRADPAGTLPWVQHGEASFVTADGTLVVQTVVDNPAEWYAGTTGTYSKPAPVTGLETATGLAHPVRNDAPGVYLLVDRAAVYTSPDGLHWTRHPVSPS
ncbi:sialidase family protein [Dactylosporangium sp. AC04546]|uniref:sialidase family protein n=1 Tax=Dactylosporangium sp. AC04546 TaxID=2862460 RepID=UPI001EE0C7BD|nr:sialidase family protein [Dactylosporangium sp. AC04546]WVK86400.1 sialidase family protein [Dactylosporangium sp. AC04546]